MPANFDGARFLRRILWIILALSLAGVAFAGALTYRELGGAAAACPSVGTPGTIFGYPACVYGLAFYTVLALLAGFALSRSGKQPSNAT